MSGDIRCRVCGEPWDSYGVRQSRKPDGDGDMTASEAKMLLEGKGCPRCKGVKPVWCGLETRGLGSPCPEGYFEEGKCIAPANKRCPHMEPDEDHEDDFLGDITDSSNTDEDPVKILMDYEEKRKR